LELLLNLVWLVITAGAFAFFALTWSRGTRQLSRVAVFMTLACVVCLLFPVISMTDDLNSSPALAEATKLKKLLFSAQAVIGLFSLVHKYSSPERMWRRLGFEQHQDKIQQEFLSFDLNRRPPPSL